MNKNGMIITSLLYAILALFILILFSIIITFDIRKTLLNNISDEIVNDLDFIPPQIIGLSELPVFENQTFIDINYSAGLIAIDNSDGDVTETIECQLSGTNISCVASDKKGNVSEEFIRKTIEVDEIHYYYTNSYQLFTPANTGMYQIELWGASGGLDGKGAYTKGQIELQTGQNVYIYVGGMPSSTEGGYNGGGSSYSGTIYYEYGGGGATDVRIVKGLWNDIYSLKSRIMVAAGGGGTKESLSGGYGGALTGGSGLASNATYSLATGGSQTSGGLKAYSTNTVQGFNGSFGKGGNSNSIASAGGGGYYGGGSGYYASSNNYTGAGGSSFISGHTGCNAINENGTHSGNTIHYSGLEFTNTLMNAGNVSMPTWDNTSTMTGNNTHGHARITFISE